MCRAESDHSEDEDEDDEEEKDEEDEKDSPREWGRTSTPSACARRRRGSCRSSGKDEEETRDGAKVQMVEISGNKAGEVAQ